MEFLREVGTSRSTSATLSGPMLSPLILTAKDDELLSTANRSDAMGGSRSGPRARVTSQVLGTWIRQVVDVPRYRSPNLATHPALVLAATASRTASSVQVRNVLGSVRAVA